MISAVEQGGVELLEFFKRLVGGWGNGSCEVQLCMETWKRLTNRVWCSEDLFSKDVNSLSQFTGEVAGVWPLCGDVLFGTMSIVSTTHTHSLSLALAHLSVLSLISSLRARSKNGTRHLCWKEVCVCQQCNDAHVCVVHTHDTFWRWDASDERF